MGVDPRFGNSSGYFKDPISGEDFTLDMPRVVKCSFENGKFVWPMVARSDGEELLKIVYRLFTEEEKELYKQYRGKSSGTDKPSKHRSPSGVSHNKEPKDSFLSEEPIKVVKYDRETAVSKKTMGLIKSCDRCYGVAQVAGLTYALIGSSKSNAAHYIPRACVPDEDFIRLQGGKQ